MKNGICDEEVCECIRDAILFKDDKCFYNPDIQPNWLNFWDDFEIYDDEMEAIVITEPYSEFELDGESYFRILKVLSYHNWDFRRIAEKYKIYVYLVKRGYYSTGHYIFYYKGKVVRRDTCPPGIYDIVSIMAKSPDFKREMAELEAVKAILKGFSEMTKEYF